MIDDDVLAKMKRLTRRFEVECVLLDLKDDLQWGDGMKDKRENSCVRLELERAELERLAMKDEEDEMRRVEKMQNPSTPRRQARKKVYHSP